MGAGPGKHKKPDSEPEVDHRWESKFHLSKSEDAEFRRAFGSVRILVVGGSGAGKSTLIRCMGFGDELGNAPESVCGRAGEQDIAKVWKHPNLPFFIHDTNGVDSDGQARIADIREYLEKQDKAPFSDKVHLIWFVLRATDNRILEYNAELMRLVGCRKQRIPLQIVVTHMDLVTPAAYARNVASHLDELLAVAGGAGAPADGSEDLKARIVKVGIVDGEPKDRVGGEEGGQVGVDPELQAQQQALQELCAKTYTVLSKEQQLTWASVQAVDVRTKLRETARIIVSRQYFTSWTWVTPTVVGFNEAALTLLLVGVRDHIGAIWGAPPALRQAVWETLGLWNGLKTPLFHKLVVGGAVLVTAPFSVTAAVGLGLVGWVYATFKEKAGTGFRKVFVTYSILVAASFLFVRLRLKVNWESKTVEEYRDLLENEFETTGLKRMLESIKIRGLLEGLVEGQDSNVDEVEALLTDYFMNSHLEVQSPAAPQ